MFSYIIVAQSRPQVTVLLYMTGYYPLDAQFCFQFFYSLILDYWLESLGGFLDKPCPPGVLLRILGGGVLHDSPNSDPISDQKLYFSAPVSRPDL